MKKTTLLLFCLLLLSNEVISKNNPDDNNTLLNKRFGAAVKLGGAYSMLGGFAVDAFIIPNINIEFDYLPVSFLSSLDYYGGGLSVHPFIYGNSRWSPYLGCFCGYASGTAFISGNPISFFELNFPVGVMYSSKRGLFFSLELGLSWRREFELEPGYRDSLYPPPSLRIGYRL